MMSSVDEGRLDAHREPGGNATRPAEYEYRLLTLPRGTSRGDARKVLTEHAEYGRWELARVRLRLGGTRQVWLRRRIMRVQRSL